VGDVLLSSGRRAGLQTNLPLVGDVNRILAAHGLPFEVSLKQKVNILSDRFVVAWSGPMEQAERALRILSAAACSGQISNKYDVARELEAIDPEKIDKLQLVGQIITDIRGDQATCSTFAWRVPRADVPGLGIVHAAGTGADEFVRHLGKTDWTGGGGSNEFEVAHLVLGSLVNMEYRRGGTVENRWGGGFEAVTFICDPGGGSGRLQKVGDILHTFWQVDLSSPNQSRFFYKTTYWRDALIVRYARFDSADGRAFQLGMNSFELIPPLLKDVKDYDLEEIGQVDFSHKVLCCHVSIERPVGRGVMHFAQPSKPGDTIELEVAKDGSGRMHIPGELQKKIIEEAQRRATRMIGDND
jgi:hypothetical protein